jgi:hypothetical protein
MARPGVRIRSSLLLVLGGLAALLLLRVLLDRFGGDDELSVLSSPKEEVGSDPHPPTALVGDRHPAGGRLVETNQNVPAVEPTDATDEAYELPEARSSSERVFEVSVTALDHALSEFRSSTGTKKLAEATALMSMYVATMLDSVGRYEQMEVGKKISLGSRHEAKIAFQYNNRVYRFDDFEFPEWTEFHSYRLSLTSIEDLKSGFDPEIEAKLIRLAEATREVLDEAPR